MIDIEILLKRLDRIEKLARGNILNRFFYNPIKYISAIGYWRLIYPIKKRGKFATAKTFFGEPMQVVLPSATEIFLFGAKTHDSEIRLARFLMKNLQSGDVFCDVGAHFGFFTLLASHIIGNKGKVISFEASRSTYPIFKKNISDKKNIIAENKAAADTNETFIFYEHSALFSEYNSLKLADNHQKEKPKEIKIEGIQLGGYFLKNKYDPKIIKIDVEGAESMVLNGMEKYLIENSPIIVMEYLTEKTQHIIHEKAIGYLKSIKYSSFVIDKNGTLTPCENVSQAMNERGLSSDNIVFIKS